MGTLDEIYVNISNETSLSLRQLLDGWSNHVGRIASEMRRPVSRETWGAHDYFAALHLRDFIALGRSELGSADAAEVDYHLLSADMKLRDITEDDTEALVLRFAALSEAEGREEWWWHRIPVAGLVRLELNDWRGASPQDGSACVR